MRGAAILWLALGAMTFSPASGHAQDVAPPSRALMGRALVYLEAEADVDEFVRVFVFEVVAGRLRDHGLAVVRGETADAEVAPMTCLRALACVRELQRAHRAPLVLAFQIARVGDELRVTWRRSDAMAERALSVQDNEGGVAAALVRTLMELEMENVPCVVLLESALDVALSVDGASVRSPGLVSPGAHEARALVADRAAWSGPLHCRGGRVLRVEVR